MDKQKSLEQKFISNLRRLPRGQGDELASYLERYYFTETRRAKWSLACRPEGWLVNHNMHVESWHKKLKYYWFGGRANKRADNCIVVLWVSWVAPWLRGSVVPWLRGSMAPWLCGPVVKTLTAMKLLSDPCVLALAPPLSSKLLVI